VSIRARCEGEEGSTVSGHRLCDPNQTLKVQVKERWHAEMSWRGSSEAVPRVRDADHGVTAENRTFEGGAMKRGVLVGMGFVFMS
jgi:hypothetical protein